MTKKNHRRPRKANVYWGSLYYNPSGNMYGYSMHNRKLLEAVRRRDDVVLSPKAKVSFALTTANIYQRIPDIPFQFLYTMFETDTLPKTYVNGLQYADVIVVPCFHNKKLFERYTDKPVEVCWEGVDLVQYPYRRRTVPMGRPFRFLWVAAPNIRKGWEILVAGWKAFHDYNRKALFWARQNYELNPVLPFELYIKTTVTENFKKDIPGVTFDSRNMTDEEMTALYHSAHAFVLPTMGEGFGLTLAEAMATGCPCIATSVTGTKDFFDDSVGYTIDAEQDEITFQDEKHKIWIPDVNSMVRGMIQCVQDYRTGAAQAKAKKAKDRIHQYITWDKSADALIRIIRKHAPPELLHADVADFAEPSYSTNKTSDGATKCCAAISPAAGG